MAFFLHFSLLDCPKPTLAGHCVLCEMLSQIFKSFRSLFSIQPVVDIVKWEIIPSGYFGEHFSIEALHRNCTVNGRWMGGVQWRGLDRIKVDKTVV